MLVQASKPTFFQFLNFGEIQISSKKCFITSTTGTGTGRVVVIEGHLHKNNKIAEHYREVARSPTKFWLPGYL